MKSSFVSVIVPAYNEANCIRRNVEQIVRYLDEKFPRFEVIVVDDGSTDPTHREVAGAAAADSRITAVSYPTNHGKGFAVRQGMLQAKGDAVLFTDADLSTPVEEIEKVVAELVAGCSVVIATRQHPQSIIRVRQGPSRELVGRSFNLLVRALFPLPFRDTQCGFKCFTRKAAQEIFSLARVNGLSFDVEILLIARRLGYGVKEVPVSWAHVDESKVGLTRNWLPIGKELFQIYWNDRKGLYGCRS